MATTDQLSIKSEILSDDEVEEGEDEENSLEGAGPSNAWNQEKQDFGTVSDDLRAVSSEIIDPNFYSGMKQVPKEIVLGISNPPQSIQNVPFMDFYALKAGMEFSFYVEHSKATTMNLTLDNLGKWNKRGAPSMVSRCFYDEHLRNVRKGGQFAYQILSYTSRNHSTQPIGSLTRKIWKGFDVNGEPLGTAIVSYSITKDFEEFHPEIQGNTRHSEKSLQRRENPSVMRKSTADSRRLPPPAIRKAVPRLMDGPPLVRKAISLDNGSLSSRKRSLEDMRKPDQPISLNDILEQLTAKSGRLFQDHTFADYSDEEPVSGPEGDEVVERLFERPQNAFVDGFDRLKAVSNDIVDFDFYSIMKAVPKEILAGLMPPPQHLKKVPRMRVNALQANMNFSFYIEHNEETTGILTNDNLGYWSRRNYPSLMNRFHFDANFKKIRREDVGKDDQKLKYEILVYISQNHSYQPVGSLKRRIWKCFDGNGKPIGTAIVSYQTTADFVSIEDKRTNTGRFELQTDTSGGAGHLLSAAIPSISPLNRDAKSFPQLMDRSGPPGTPQIERNQFYCWLCPTHRAGQVGYEHKESLQMHFLRNHSKEEFKMGIDKLINQQPPRSTIKVPPCYVKKNRPTTSSQDNNDAMNEGSQMKLLKLLSTSYQYSPFTKPNIQEELKKRLTQLQQTIDKTATYLIASNLDEAENYISGLEAMATLENSTFDRLTDGNDLLNLPIPGIKQVSSNMDFSEENTRSCSICLQSKNSTGPKSWLRCEECLSWTHEFCREVDLPCPSCLRGLLKRQNNKNELIEVKREVDT